MIERSKDFFVLRLNSSLYDKESVMEALEELKRHADASFKNGDYFMVKIRKTAEAEKYSYEFLNYVLKIMKNKGVA